MHHTIRASGVLMKLPQRVNPSYVGKSHPQIPQTNASLLSNCLSFFCVICGWLWHPQQSEPLDYASVNYVLLDNLRHVGRPHLRVPNTVRIDHHGGANRTEPNRTTFG